MKFLPCAQFAGSMWEINCQYWIAHRIIDLPVLPKLVGKWQTLSPTIHFRENEKNEK